MTKLLDSVWAVSLKNLISTRRAWMHMEGNKSKEIITGTPMPPWSPGSQ